MIGKLRCNTIIRDWHDELDMFYSIMGHNADSVLMNIKTLRYMIAYLNKNPKYGYMNVRRNYVDARDGRGHIAAQFLDNVYIEFHGVKIIIDDCLGDEIIKVL